jgi:hypothetical protein
LLNVHNDVTIPCMPHPIPIPSDSALPTLPAPLLLPGQVWRSAEGKRRFRVKWIATRTADPYDCWCLARYCGSYASRELWVRKFRQDRSNGYVLLEAVDPSQFAPPAAVAGIWELPASRYRPRRPALLAAVIPQREADFAGLPNPPGWELQPPVAAFELVDGSYEYHPLPLPTTYHRLTPDAEVWGSMVSEAMRRVEARATGPKARPEVSRSQAEVRRADRRKLLQRCRARQEQKVAQPSGG